MIVDKRTLDLKERDIYLRKWDNDRNNSKQIKIDAKYMLYGRYML